MLLYVIIYLTDHRLVPKNILKMAVARANWNLKDYHMVQKEIATDNHVNVKK